MCFELSYSSPGTTVDNTSHCVNIYCHKCDLWLGRRNRPVNSYSMDKERLSRVWMNKCIFSYTWNISLLFISYKFVKGFLSITFLLFVISSWNFHDVCQRFLYNQERNFSLIRQKTKIFPIDPHYKNRTLL